MTLFPAAQSQMCVMDILAGFPSAPDSLSFPQHIPCAEGLLLEHGKLAKTLNA